MIDIGTLGAGLIGLIGGGLINGGSNRTNTQTTTQTAQLPPALQAAIDNMIRNAQDVSAQPYQQYPGPRIADFTPDQQRAFEMFRQLPGTGLAALGRAESAYGDAGRAFNTENLQPYVNAYEQDRLRNTMDELRRQKDIAQLGVNDAAVRAGAFGGSRHGVADAELERALSRTQADTLTSENARIFDAAAGRFQNDRSNSLQVGQAFSGLAPLQYNLQQQGATALGTSGAQQQQLGQANLDLGVSDFETQRNYSRDQLAFLSSILSGTPYAQNQTTSLTTPAPSRFQQVAGLGIAGLGLLGSAPASSAIGRWMN